MKAMRKEEQLQLKGLRGRARKVVTVGTSANILVHKIDAFSAACHFLHREVIPEFRIFVSRSDAVSHANRMRILRLR